MTELSPLAWRLRRCLLALDRQVVQLGEVWACLLTMAPELRSDPDRRATLRGVIDELTAAGWLRLPTDRADWSRRPEPSLPRTVRLQRPEERARRLRTGRGAPWSAPLAWVADEDLSDDDLADLAAIDAWLGAADRVAIVPPRERSLQLFGAGREDRLHELSRTALFAPGRLSWELLGCAPVPPPFVWSRVGGGDLLLVISGHETFASVRRALVDAPHSPVGTVAHGAGAYFASSVASAATLDHHVERIVYYGDLAADDLRTPRAADVTARRAGLPAVEPATAMYELLLHHGRPAGAAPVPIDDARELAGWLTPSVAEHAVHLLVGGRRLAQEWVGYELMMRERVWAALA